MKKLLIEAAIFPFVWLYYTIPELSKYLRGALQTKIKFDIHTFIGIGLVIYFYLIFSGRIDQFQAFRHGLDVVAHEGTGREGGVFLGLLFGIPLILFGRGPMVFLGYMLMAVQWLIMVSFEDPKPIKIPPKTAYILQLKHEATHPLPPLV